MIGGANAMIRINGGRVKSLRESKGLTQLYLATVIGVTTDTISRWENKKYPSIKLENAEKLAGALEVDMEAFVDPQESPITEGEGREVEDSPIIAAVETGFGVEVPPPSRLKFIWLALLLLLLGLGVVLFFFLRSGGQNGRVSAVRILPPHVPAGQTFPVLIRVDLGDTDRSALILRELLPANCEVLCASPTATGSPVPESELKWIRRPTEGRAVFIYTLRAPDNVGPNDELSFSGTLVRQKEGRNDITVGGDSMIRIDSHHWADSNRDGRVDDEEILEVYDIYGEEPAVEFDRNLIDEIWAANGYFWDAEKKSYKVGKQGPKE